MSIRRETTTGTLIDLTDRAALDSSLVGSKAANLASLLSAGFPVPDGVVIPDGTDVDTPLIDGLSDRFGDTPLAVRSSATSEDLADASYAGQYETYLAVRGREDLTAAIAACRASLRTQRVSTYTGSTSQSSMAVLIQQMVNAVAAGVAFSAHPVTGVRDVGVINAVPGLGDKLVSGEVTPEEWEVDGSEARLVAAGQGVLDKQRAQSIAELARKVESHFDTPQDIEWAIDGSSLYLLQARPITALPEAPIEPIPIEFEVPSGYWEHDASHFKDANYPIESFTPALVEEAVKTWVAEFGYLFDGIEIRDIGGWMYQRLTPMGGRDGPALPGWLMWLLVRTVPMIRRRLAVAEEAIRSDKPGRYIERWHDVWLPELAESISELRSVDLTSLTDEALRDHIAAAQRLGSRGIEIHGMLHGSMAVILYQLVTTCDRLLGWDMSTALEMVRGTSYKSTEPARRLHELTKLAKDKPELLDPVGLLDSDVVPWLESKDPVFAKAFKQYLDDYGHVALGQTVVQPTHAEMPSFLLARIRHQLETGFEPEAIEDANRVRRDRAVDAARQQLADDPDALAGFERVLRRAQQAYPVREDNEFYTFSRPFAQFRYSILELGERLAHRGLIAERDDVMFLQLTEALDALSSPIDLKATVELRKGQRAWAVANPGPPFYGREQAPPSSLSFLPEDARLPMEAMLWSLDSIEAVETSKTLQSNANAIEGIPASAGAYTGPVRLVRDESEFSKIEAGDVLVCPITSPVWSVLFPSIGALVTDTGGILSHPAIIAREYGIPAVVATGNATALLKDNQIVTVDGSFGSIVKRHEGART